MPGTSFTYTLTVSNAGTTNPAVGEPITVIDDLPAGISFASPLPAGCSTSGQRLTCTVAPSALQVGQHVVISFPATVNADASGTVVNKAWVTTQHDPACAGTDCVPPCPGVS